MLAAGGSGTRMGGVPKQFAPLAGVPLLLRALRPFAALPGLDRAVVVVPRAERDRAAALLRALDGDLAVRVVHGGDTRQASVRLGLEEVGEVETVLVHDAARPLVEPALVRRVLVAARDGTAAVPVVPLRDTVKRERDGSVETLPRGELRAAQTPQGFPAAALRAAHRRAAEEGLEATDDAALFERYALPVRLVEGQPSNLKITDPGDWALAEALLSAAEGPRAGGAPAYERTVRTGFGYDVHRLQAGRACVLGGARFDAERGPVGHSDGDVLTHAVMDALLGAAGEPDIGHRFPDADPRWAGADSVALLASVARELAARFEVLHVDAVLVAEAPRIGGRVAEIRERLAQALAVPVSRVNVKATTAEGLGPVGRGEGIVAHAVATLRERA